MTKNEDILKPFEVIERQTLEVENVVEKNKYFTILFFSQLYTQLDTCQKFHPYSFFPRTIKYWISLKIQVGKKQKSHINYVVYLYLNY